MDRQSYSENSVSTPVGVQTDVAAMAIMTSHTEVETITAPWPKIQAVESASELHDILLRGPYEWRLNQHNA